MGVKIRELADDAVTLKEILKSTLSDTAERIVSNFGFDVNLDDKILDKYKTFERDLADSFLGIGGERLTENELAYIIRSLLFQMQHMTYRKNLQEELLQIFIMQ